MSVPERKWAKGLVIPSVSASCAVLSLISGRPWMCLPTAQHTMSTTSAKLQLLNMLSSVLPWAKDVPLHANIMLTQCYTFQNLIEKRTHGLTQTWLHFKASIEDLLNPLGSPNEVIQITRLTPDTNTLKHTLEQPVLTLWRSTGHCQKFVSHWGLTAGGKRKDHYLTHRVLWNTIRLECSMIQAGYDIWMLCLVSVMSCMLSGFTLEFS